MLHIIPAEKTDEDAKLIMKWRNNPITRKNSLKSTLKLWETFKVEYYNNYFKNTPLFAILNNKKIAFISFLKMNDSTYKIGINISPEYRGKGLSTNIIKESICYIKIQNPNIKKILAEIKNFNIPSIKTFTKVGFICEIIGNINVYSFKL